MGRGATAAALAWRAFLRETFLPGCNGLLCQMKFQNLSRCDRTRHACSPSRPPLRVGMCSCKSYLVEVGSDPTLPILAEV